MQTVHLASTKDQNVPQRSLDYDIPVWVPLRHDALENLHLLPLS